jgi:hypothetical protein
MVISQEERFDQLAILASVLFVSRRVYFVIERAAVSQTASNHGTVGINRIDRLHEEQILATCLSQNEEVIINCG